jgi:5-methylcytosine-specific restriction endonuclease McrA
MKLEACSEGGAMAFKRLKKLFAAPTPHLRREDAMRIFKRDHFRCYYCGLDGLHRFENWLVLTVDHIHPQAKGGGRVMSNLVTACQPCNVIKGKRVFKSAQEAKEYVLAKREEWRRIFQEQVKAT